MTEIADKLEPNAIEQWDRRKSVLGACIKSTRARGLVNRYLEHRAMGGRVKDFLVAENVTWLELDQHLKGKVYPLVVTSNTIAAVARLQAAEDEAFRRAVEGTEEPVYHKGAICGHVRRYSDSLLTLLLKAGDPDKYADRSKVTHQGAVLHLTVENMR